MRVALLYTLQISWGINYVFKYWKLMTEIDKLGNLKILYTNLQILQSFLRFFFWISICYSHSYRSLLKSDIQY